MRIVQVSDALTIGGAETFALRLSAALAARGHDVVVVALRGDLVDRELVAALAPDVELVAVRVPLFALLRRLDGLLHLAGCGFSLVRWAQARALAGVLRKRGPDAVHSHLVTADLVTAGALGAKGKPRWIATMHGDYLALQAAGGSRAARIADFAKSVARIEERLDAVACISQPQLHQMRALMPSLDAKGGISAIYNGYAVPVLSGDRAEPAALSAIPAQAFVIGMVARGIAEKGWDTLVAAFEQLALPDAWLVLVGEGEALDQLRARNRNPRILFCGGVRNPLSWIARFDVACLPSRFAAESLPTVVIEYMVMGKPVIATAVGEIPTMLEVPGAGVAGILIPRAEAVQTAPALAEALRTLHADPALRGELGRRARVAAERFSMDSCVDAYLRLYAGVNG